MKFTVPRVAFAAAVKAARSVTGKTHIPILTHVLLTATDGRLTMTATDMERSIAVSMAATVTEPGACCVDATVLAAAVTGSRADDVTGSLAATLTLTIGVSRFRLRILPPADFPLFPEHDSPEVVIDGAVLARALSRVDRAMSQDSSRAMLNGVHIESRHGGRLVACDTAQLVTHSIELPPDMVDAIIPANAVTMLRTATGATSVRVTPARLSASWTDEDDLGIAFTTKVVEGPYPDVDRFIVGAGMDPTVIVDRKVLLDALTRVSSLSKDRVVSLRIGDGKMVLACHGSQGTARDEVECFTTADIALTMQSRVLAEVLEMAMCEEVALRLTEPTKPVRIDAVGDETWMGIAMPWLTAPVFEED